MYETKIIINLTKQIKDMFIQMNLFHYRLYNTLRSHTPVSDRCKQNDGRGYDA